MRLLPSIAVAALLLGLVPTACAAGRASPCAPTQVTRSGKVPSVQASPATTGIVGVLLDGKLPVAARPSHIRWLVDSRRAADQLQVIVGRQDVNQSYEMHVPRTRESASLSEFDSTLRFPNAGCWLVDVSSGSADAMVTFDVQAARTG